MNGVAFHRLYTPFARLQVDHGVTVDVSQSQDEWASLEYEKYDVIIFNRWLGRLQYNILPILAKKKIPFILDLDDYWVIPKHNPAYKFYKAYLKNGVKDAMSYADAVMVTTEQLKEKVEEFNSNVAIVPNTIDTTQSQWKEEVIHPLTIGWVGGLSHTEDLKLLSDQIKPICEEYGARFLMCGFHENVKEWYEMEKAITGEPRYKRPEWFQTRTGTRADKYGAYYSEIDIALAPLTAAHFNRYKSELKIIEASVYKLPILVSKVEPYTNHIDNKGVTFVEKNDWQTPLKAILESENWKQQGLLNYEYCQTKHDIREANKKRIEVIKKVIDGYSL